MVTSPEEKMYALKLLTDNLVPDRWDNSRVPPTAAEMASTSVIRVDIASASAKVRAYSAGNDRADLDDKDMCGRVWTGVVPATISYSEPIPARENLVPEVPQFIKEWVKKTNEDGEEYARRVAAKAGPMKS